MNVPVPRGFDWQTATRAERVELVQRLRGRGFLNREIGAAVGAASTTISQYFSDPFRVKRKAQLERMSGVCADCGGPTRGGQGHDRVSMRCRWCALGMPRPRERLCVPVRLADVPLEVRLNAVRDAARGSEDAEERMLLLMTALEPSPRVYWVAESARELVESWNGKGRP